jgi:hypothetical protein
MVVIANLLIVGRTPITCVSALLKGTPGKLRRLPAFPGIETLLNVVVSSVVSGARSKLMLSALEGAV